MKKRTALFLLVTLLMTAVGCAGIEIEAPNKGALSDQDATKSTGAEIPPTQTEPMGVATTPGQTAGSIPWMELAGTWERIHTEVDGCIEETPAGQVTIEITGSSEADLLITYTDNAFPNYSYSEKTLCILTDGDTMGFGDVEWTAEVDHIGSYGQTSALAMVDDLLIVRNYFTVDGGRGVSYETFRRVN